MARLMTQKKQNTNKDKTTSKLSDHKRFKKELNPPFLQIPNLRPSSWLDNRLPEMLWTVLIIGNLDREQALNFFRFIADYVRKNPECHNLTMSGISKFSDIKRNEFISNALAWSDQIRITLRPLALFPELPGAKNWKNFLGEPVPEEDWQKLANGIRKTFWHQSQEATDCRWIKLLGIILGSKLDLNGMEEDIKGILEYPNYGDLRHVRPVIRAMEITPNLIEDYGTEWPNNFWRYCFGKTFCMPEEGVNKEIQEKRTSLIEEIGEIKSQYFTEAKELRYKVIDHFFEHAKTSGIDSRYEGAFGLALYGLTLFIEIICYRIPLSITGRLSLRTLVEILITFKYLITKEKAYPEIWENYRNYGTGQLKLVYLKIQEMNKEINCIDLKIIEEIVNEDKWIEFIPINLGHWDSLDLRKISDEVGLKEIYDTYYNYTSGYMHANWGAIRESVYQKCVNPLHRFHRGPILDMPLMSSITADVVVLVNGILECLSEAYPKFDFRLHLTEQLSNK